jgi:nitrogen fixation protein NifX
MLKIAVATSDGVTIDLHFGQANSFQIFNVGEDGSHYLLEQRDVSRSPSGAAVGEHPATTTIEQLTDVDVVLVNRIGDGPLRALEERGIRAYSLDGSLERALTAYGRRHKLFMMKYPRVPRVQDLAQTGCGSCSSHGKCH